MQLTAVRLHKSVAHFNMQTAHCDVLRESLSFCQNGVCGCEKGFTEVMTSYGFLDYCTRTPGLDHKKADVKSTAGRLRPEHTRNKNLMKDWALQPLGPGTNNNHMLDSVMMYSCRQKLASPL